MLQGYLFEYKHTFTKKTPTKQVFLCNCVNNAYFRFFCPALLSQQLPVEKKGELYDIRVYCCQEQQVESPPQAEAAPWTLY